MAQAAAVIEAIEAGVKIITVAPVVKEPTKEPSKEPVKQPTNINNGISPGEKGGNVRNEVIKEIEEETLRLMEAGELAGKLTSAYDPEWEYELRELLDLFDF